MILLDTNICIYITNERPVQVFSRFRAYQAGDIGLSSIVAAELAYGVSKSGSDRNRRALDLFLAPLVILPFDARCIWKYGQLRAVLERQGEPIGSMDLLIAAHALNEGATLVTNNLKEFSKVPGLALENWAA